MTPDVVWLVHYPVREDGCLQYKDIVFVDRIEAWAFARKYDVDAKMVPCV